MTASALANRSLRGLDVKHAADPGHVPNSGTRNVRGQAGERGLHCAEIVRVVAKRAIALRDSSSTGALSRRLHRSLTSPCYRAPVHTRVRVVMLDLALGTGARVPP